MPQELETRTTDAGEQQIYINGEWKPIKQKTQAPTLAYPIDVSINLAGNTYSGKARMTESKHGKNGRTMIAIKIDEGQAIYGGGSFSLRV